MKRLAFGFLIFGIVFVLWSGSHLIRSFSSFGFISNPIIKGSHSEQKSIKNSNQKIERSWSIKSTENIGDPNQKAQGDLNQENRYQGENGDLAKSIDCLGWNVNSGCGKNIDRIESSKETLAKLKEVARDIKNKKAYVTEEIIELSKAAIISQNNIIAEGGLAIAKELNNSDRPWDAIHEVAEFTSSTLILNLSLDLMESNSEASAEKVAQIILKGAPDAAIIAASAADRFITENTVDVFRKAERLLNNSSRKNSKAHRRLKLSLSSRS